MTEGPLANEWRPDAARDLASVGIGPAGKDSGIGDIGRRSAPGGWPDLVLGESLFHVRRINLPLLIRPDPLRVRGMEPEESPSSSFRPARRADVSENDGSRPTRHGRLGDNRDLAGRVVNSLSKETGPREGGWPESCGRRHEAAVVRSRV